MSDFIDADKLTEPLVFCTISGGDAGWFHAVVQTSAKTVDEAKALAEAFVMGIFPGRHKFIREDAEAGEDRDFEHDCRIVRGFARFSFRLEDGHTERRGGVRTVGFGQ